MCGIDILNATQGIGRVHIGRFVVIIGRIYLETSSNLFMFPCLRLFKVYIWLGDFPSFLFLLNADILADDTGFADLTSEGWLPLDIWQEVWIILDQPLDCSRKPS